MPGPVKVSKRPKLNDEQKELARVLSDPGQWVNRFYWPDPMYAGSDHVEYEELHIWQARAVQSYLHVKARREPVPVEAEE